MTSFQKSANMADSSGYMGASCPTAPIRGQRTPPESESPADSNTQSSSEGSQEVRSKIKRSHELVDQFNQEKFNSAITRMIIVDMLPFEFVENPGFREFSALLAAPVESFGEFFSALLTIPTESPVVASLQELGNNLTYDELVEFHQEFCTQALAKMIIIDELPFKFVENKGFGEFVTAFQPQFKIPSQITIVEDCMNLHRVAKAKLKFNLSQNKQMMSLTTDTWTSIHNKNYLCVTAHCIDERWELIKMILSFVLIPDHKGDTIGKALEKCLKEWEITKICTITVHNADTENLASSYLIQNMCGWNGTTLLNGEHVHLRCCTHILNSIVSDGLQEMDCCIARIRAACKYVRSFSSRYACFKRCANGANINCDQMIVLDEPTKWNSTYLMLVVAEKFEKAFNLLEFEDDSYVKSLDNEGGPPSADDWNRARVFIKVLKVFYEATLSFSGYLNVSSNSFLRMWVKIQNALRSWMENDDFGLQQMATTMKLKFDKYWDIDGNINNLLFVAIFLDPRFKFKYLEFCFGRMYGPEKCKDMLKKLEDFIKELFTQYSSSHPIIPDICESSGLSFDVTSQTIVSNDDGGNMDMDEEYGITVKKMLDELEKNELERYMKDHVEVNYDGFDILRWWKGKSTKYYVLAHMARDILAIPVSSVSFEDAFSTGDHVLDRYHSCLDPTTVEALICSKSWLSHNLRKNWDSHQTFDVVQAERDMLEDSDLEEYDATTLEALVCLNSWLSDDIGKNGDSH
ncbi:putative AC transposase [Glycine soja]|uniref:Putative AC transposase n=1 Tax=Glycine soja TaxID=3848 RepID=A0A445JC80_GLYSO|nr:putative AC transposase [Glycine soja]